MPFYAGKTGFISVLGINLTLEEWSLELEVEEIELTNFESYGFKSIIGGIRGGTISGSGTYNGTTPLSQFQSGTIVSAKLGLITSTGFGFPVSILITGMTFGMNVKEKATFEFSGTLTNIDSSGAINATQNQNVTPA
jgi:hypothetical protein